MGLPRVPSDRLRAIAALALLIVVTPGVLLAFSLAFGPDVYRPWGDRYDADLTNKHLFAHRPTAGLVTPFWRDDIVGGTTWHPTLHVAPLAVEVQAARLFALGPFAIDLLAELLLVLVAATGMHAYVRVAHMLSREAATAAGAMHAAAVYTVAQHHNIPEFAMPAAVLPLVLALAHRVHDASASGRPRAAGLAAIGVAVVTAAGAAQSSPAVFPPVVPLSFLYACLVLRTLRAIAGVGAGLLVGLLLYSPFLALLLDATVTSRRMLAPARPGPHGLAEAVDRIHGLGSQIISAPTIWGTSLVLIVAGLAWLTLGARWRERPPLSRRAIGFGLGVTVFVLLVYVFPGVATDLKSGVALLRNWHLSRLPAFASFGVIPCAAWMFDRWLFRAGWTEVSSRRRRLFRLGLVFAAADLVLQAWRVGRWFGAETPVVASHRVLGGAAMVVFVVVLLAFLLTQWRAAAGAPREAASPLRNAALVVLSTTSLAAAAASVPAFVVPRAAWQSPEPARPMTYRQRYESRPEYAIVRRLNDEGARVSDLRFPIVMSPRLYLGGSELAALPRAGARTVEGYATLYPVSFGRLVVEVINGDPLLEIGNMLEIRDTGRTRFDLLPLLDVGWIFAPAGRALPPPYAVAEVLGPERGTLYRLGAAERLGPAFVSADRRCVRSDEEAVQLLRAMSLPELRSHAVLVETDPAARPLCRRRETPPVDRGPRAIGRVHRMDDRVRITVDEGPPGILTLSDSYAPGWQVTVDGAARPLLRTYLALRGVALDGGRHDVEFTYVPRMFRPLATVSCAIFAGLGLGALLLGPCAWLRRHGRSR